MTTAQNEVIIARNARAFRQLAEVVPEVSKIEIWQLEGQSVRCLISKIDFNSSVDPSPNDIRVIGQGASLTEAVTEAIVQYHAEIAGHCYCGEPLPRVPDNQTPFEFCSDKCKQNK